MLIVGLGLFGVLLFWIGVVRGLWPLIKDERLPRAHPHHYRPAGIDATGRRWLEVTEGCSCTTGVCRREPG
jgi:hypothetical protein